MRRRAIAAFGLVCALGLLAWVAWPNHVPVEHVGAAVVVAPRPRVVAPRARVASNTTASPGWIRVENARRGTSEWRIAPGTARTIDGYADHVSVQDGDQVKLYVSTAQPAFRVEAYRMGWYQGLAGRLVWRSPAITGTAQRSPVRAGNTRTVVAPWSPSLALSISSAWPPGDYLLKLIAGPGASYVPLTVRDDQSHAPVLVVNAVTTWQAYNDWGGYDLYNGPRDDPKLRSSIVSFDRPYRGSGADEFISNELGLITVVERMGLDVSYSTDIDLHERPALLQQHHVVVSLGHDEYWTPEMRAGIQAARDRGVNLMFLGANAVFRRIRLNPSQLGPDRLEINYRVARADPLYGIDNTQVTTNWREPPHPRPESTLTGVYYECNPVNVDGVVADQKSWVFAGAGLTDGSHIPSLVGSEYDRVNPYAPTPSPIEVLFHSPLTCRHQPSYADAAYYSAPGGADVFDTGTGAWICTLYVGCPTVDPRIVRITENILAAYALGPAAAHYPAVPNLATLHISSTSTTPAPRHAP